MAASIFSASTGMGILAVLLFIAYFVLLVFTVMRGLHYVFTQYVMFDSGNSLHGKEAAEKSEQLMQGHRGEYFVFALSFLGWIILGSIPLGIGLLWVIPYMQISLVIFYEKLKGVPEVTKQPKPEPVTEPEHAE